MALIQAPVTIGVPICRDVSSEINSPLSIDSSPWKFCEKEYHFIAHCAFLTFHFYPLFPDLCFMHVKKGWFIYLPNNRHICYELTFVFGFCSRLPSDLNERWLEKSLFLESEKKWKSQMPKPGDLFQPVISFHLSLHHNFFPQPNQKLLRVSLFLNHSDWNPLLRNFRKTKQSRFLSFQ